ncbi:MAG: SWIM zinc finger family protein [Stanieria sp.]
MSAIFGKVSIKSGQYQRGLKIMELANRQWWVERWLELLDSYRFKKRLERGRNYAREGNVLSIEFVGSQVLAKVQGSEAQPYQVSLSLASFTDEDWSYITQTMSEKAIFSAQLLAGEMPANIEDVFTANGLSLFPFSLTEIRSRCSCPDKANPCKHIAAVYYQLSDRFSEDPFVLFQLRGRTKTEILDTLRQLRSNKVGSDTKTSQLDSTSDVIVTEKSSEPIKSKTSENIDLKNFWQYDEPLEPSLVVITPPTEGKTILDLLGDIPLATADAEALKQFLIQVYQTASQQAIMTALNRDST